MFDMQAVSTSGTGPLASVSAVSPLDFIEVDYHPGLLLPVSFDRSIMDDPEYANSCEHGYDQYFAEMLTGTTLETLSWEARVYTRSTVTREIIREMTFIEEDGKRAPLAWRVGFFVGWLSALAFTDEALAWFGVEVLTGCIRREQCERGHGSKASRVCGGDGFPLDM
jgi:hypothetical protein